MKILGVNMSSNRKFRITDNDRLWVEENFRWLKTVFGYPNKLQPQILFNAEFFPETFNNQPTEPRHVIADLCKLFGIRRETVRFEIVTDDRDWKSASHEIHRKVFECETELRKGDYLIYVSNRLLQHRDPLVSGLIYEFVQIRLVESEIEYNVGGDDTSLFIFLAGIYYGFGVILAQNSFHAEDGQDQTWELKWKSGSPMPIFLMAFALATYSNLRGEEDPSWKNEFVGDFRKIFDEAITFIRENPNDLYDESEVKSNDLFEEAEQHFEDHRLDEAIATLQKILFLTQDDMMKADVYNNMGYYYILKKNYQQGISNFRKALALGSEYGFANDNLGYSLIVTNELEEGLSHVKKAMQTGNNDIAYSYRNLALYHQKKKQPELAEEFFQKSFGENTPVDLLEYHYGEFLLEQKLVEKATEFFRKSAEKNEEPGLSKLRELGLR